jgi:hypothetical protein
MSQKQFRITAKAGGDTGNNQVFEFSPGVKNASKGFNLQSRSRACFDAGWITVAKIAFHDLVGEGIVSDPSIRTGKRAKLAVHAFLLRPLNHPGLFILV